VASTRIADHIGRVLAGRYRLRAAIGTGASAHVFLADDVRLARRVAVKILHPALADDAAFLRRFRAEARAAAALNHPNVLAVYDWGEEADGPFIVTEFLGGGSLRSMLDKGRRLTVSQALLVGLQAASGLDYAHRRGLVHRDIKPANLLFDDEGRLRIADFGLARALAEAAWTEPSGALLGTARYAAPEQVRGIPLDGKSDVYSLAVVLVEAVTGRVPFAAETTLGTILSRLELPLEVPDELGPMAPVLARAGQPDPVGRPDAMAFGAALQTVAQTLPSPDPLPLAGAAEFDEVAAVIDSDPTDMGLALTDSSTPTEVQAAVAPPSDPIPTLTPTAVITAPEAVATTPVGGRRRRRWPWTVLVSLVAIVGSIVGALALVDAQVPTHPVPDLTNDVESMAIEKLRPLGFEVQIQREYVDGTEQGQVVSQTPAPRVDLKEGKTIHLVVSRGPTPVDIPDLTGLDQQEAAARLEAAGLEAGAVTLQYSEAARAGLVLDWAPKGVQQPKGSAVALTVSQGPQPRAIPTVEGMTYEQAVKALEDAGLQAARVDVFHDDVAANRAVGTRPPWGTQVARGSTVTIVISKGQPEVPRLLGKTEADAKASLEAVELKLGNVYGPNGGRVVLQTPDAGSRQKKGTSVNVYLI
jgi:serine/threonine-protein kinase